MKAFIIFIIILGFIFYAGIFFTLFIFGAGSQNTKMPIRIIAMDVAVAALIFMIIAIKYLLDFGCPL
ncbi:MAG: hypothetical protein J1E01_01315 [Acetatifactor sp.]|nr:hypothetical protein [Acetatifactor sp.]